MMTGKKLRPGGARVFGLAMGALLLTVGSWGVRAAPSHSIGTGVGEKTLAAVEKPPYDRPVGAIAMPDFPPGLTWFNVKQPISLRSLRGKMVLLDFWTYG